MNVLFIIYKYGIPLDDPCCYPLGAMYVSSSLKQAGHNVKVLNYNLFDYDLESEINGIDVVFFTGFEEFLPLIKRDAAYLKGRGIKTAVGGALATFATSLMATICDEVVVGEYEDDLIGDIPFPDYDGFGIEEYHRRHNVRYMGVLTSRGCPYHCSFCSSTCQYRERSIESVTDEIASYKEKYGITHIVFNDNTINVRKKRIIGICEMMAGLGLTWSAAFRLDVIDDEICIAVKESGCSGMIVGVESFNQKYIDQMNKAITVNQITTGLDLLNEYGIDYYGNVLFGLNHQTNEEIERELISIPGEYNIFPCMVRPFVGTSEGRKLSISEEDWNKWDNLFKEYIISKGRYCYPDLKEAI